MPCSYYEQYDLTIPSTFVYRPISCGGGGGTCDCAPYVGTFRLTRNPAGTMCPPNSGAAYGNCCRWQSLANRYSSDFCPDAPCTIGTPLWTLQATIGPPIQWSLDTCSGLNGGYISDTDSLCTGGSARHLFGGTNACCSENLIGGGTATLVGVAGTRIDCRDDPPGTGTGSAFAALPPGFAALQPRPMSRIRLVLGGRVLEADWDGVSPLSFDVKGTVPPGTPDGVVEAQDLTAGPGTELKKLLNRFGIKPKRTCQCNSRMLQMDQWGVAGCRANRDTILAWMREEFAQLGWLTRIKLGVAAAGSMLFGPSAALDPVAAVVDLAIQLADVP